MAWLLRTVETRPLWLNSARCAMPVYRAAPRQRRVRVRLARSAYQDPALLRALRSVPIPADAEPANCSDRNLAVTQRRRGGRVTQWELWRAQRTRRGWVAGWAGVIHDVRKDRGFASPLQWRDRRARRYVARHASVKWNVTASSASMTAGVITASDLRRGRIDHALAVALPDVARGVWVWPAQRTDGGAERAGRAAHGSRLRLDPSLDLRRLTLPPLVRMMAEAAQRYGIIVRDRTWTSTAFYTERLSPADAQRRDALLGGSPDRVLRRFPWASLQVLRAPRCTDWNGCFVHDRARIDVDGPAVAGEMVLLDTRNSELNFPRRSVRWDLDGDGRDETRAGARLTQRLRLRRPGPLRIRVRIATRNGRLVTASRRLDVGR